MVEELSALDGSGLRNRLEKGFRVDPTALDDSRYHGLSLGLPGWVDRLAWKTFEKTFHRDGDRLRGWNVRLKQGQEAIEPMLKGAQPLTFGHYEVQDQGPRLLLDYSPQPWWDPSRWVRDPLVALEEGSVAWLLGRSLLGSLGTPSYFLLRRIGPLEHIPLSR